MKTKKRWLILGCFLIFLMRSAESLAAAYPSGSTYTHIQTCFDRVDIYSSARQRLMDVGYTCNVSLSGDVSLLNIYTAGSYSNILLWASHGGSGYVIGEQTFATVTEANTRKTFLEATPYQSGDLVVVYEPAVSKYAVALTSQGIKNNFTGTLACVASCISSSTAGQWGSHEVGYASVINGGTAQTEMTSLFNSLTAKDNFEEMTVTSAINGNQSVMKGGAVALVPWVASYQPTGYYINTQYVTVTVTFGGPMQSVEFAVGGLAVKKAQGGSGNAWWVQLQTGWAIGEVIVGEIDALTKSSNGIACHQDWHISYSCQVDGYPPAASVASFIPYLEADGVRVYTDLSMMRASEAFWVERLDGSLVGDTVWVDKITGHEFEIFDAQGRPNEVYRLKEQEKNGRVFIRASEGVFEKKPEIVSDEPRFEAEILRQELTAKYGLGRRSSSAAPTGLIICPDSLATDAQILADFWQIHGRTVAVKTLSETGYSREEIKAYLLQAYANGVRYVLLAGSASDYEWFDDPTKWPDLPGEDDWYYWYQDYHTPGGYFYWVSAPGRNLIPTWYFPDTAYDNMSYWTPYYSGDWYYGEGLPELRIGRFPAANRQQLLAMIAKDIEYVEEVNFFSWQNKVSVWGFCQSWDGNDGPLMRALLLDFIQQIPETYQIYALLDTAWTYSQREAQALADWNSGRGLIWMQGTSSTPYKANQFFSKSSGWSVSKLEEGKLTLLVGASCGIGAYDLAQSPTYSEPVVQDLLAADPDRGAWAVIAPTRGTWIEGNRQMGQLLNHHLSQEPVQDLGTAFMLSQREVRQGVLSMCAESYNLLGDPMAPLPGKTVTEAGDLMPSYQNTLCQNYPNPFNPVTTIEYLLGRDEYVSLKIYNVAGQLVLSLLDERQTSGQYRERWDGRDSQGRPVASGVYFCRLKTDSFFQVRKMILLR